jgi:hypothetical protein
MIEGEYKLLSFVLTGQPSLTICIFCHSNSLDIKIFIVKFVLPGHRINITTGDFQEETNINE